MKRKLENYIDVIKKLPLKESYSKEELLTKDFFIESEGKLEVYYSPHNDYINPKGRILIVGITPGFNQMSTALATARRCVEEGMDINEIAYRCKVAGRFSGGLRKNIISMLDEVQLNSVLGIESCSELFDTKDYLLHTVSLIPYPVFYNKNNYSGHTPKLIRSQFLMKYVYNNFLEEYKALDNPLIIPLGKAVEEVLEEIVVVNLIKGFPHPSGANVNRVSQLKENKEWIIKQIKDIF